MNNSIELTPIGLFDTGIFDDGAAEIPAFDATSQRLFVTNGANDTIDALDLSDPSNPTLAFAIDITPFGDGINSVAVNDGIVAAAIESDPATEPGLVVFFDSEGNVLNQVAVGALPDQLTFSPDGTKVLVANEGEADEDDPSINPEGSVSIIDLADGVENASVSFADFTAFDGQEDELRELGIRIFPDVSVSEDVEPEFITVSGDGSTAFVALQENNAIAVVDIEQSEVVELQPLGAIDFSTVALDASDGDGGINIANQPVFGLFQPDSIDSYEVDGETFVVTANEGDSRDEEVDVVDIELDPEVFPDAAELQTPEVLGNLEVSSIDGDLDGDGDFDQLFAYGSRSFSIRDSQGNIVFDSGDDFEQITAELVPGIFNSNGDVESFDERSNDSGPEPEGIVLGEIEGRTFAFIGLERTGGIMVYDVTVPAESEFVQYINPLDAETGDAANIAPEGLAFIPAEESPNGSPLLAVANEISGTTSIFEINTDALDEETDSTAIEFIGEVSFETGFTFGDTEVGGLSGLTFDPINDVFYIISDDQSTVNDARYYDVTIDLSDGTLDEGDIEFVNVTTLLNAAGDPFATGSVDAEGIVLNSEGQLFISSEGDADNLIDPFINEVNLSGQVFNELPINDLLLPTVDQSSGVQDNLALESLTITPDGSSLFTASENALFQDGESATLEAGSPVRIVQYDLETEEEVAQFFYETDPIAFAPDPADGFATNGLVELLAVDNEGSFLALERSFSVGVGNNIRLYEIDLSDAPDISGVDSLSETDINPVEKDLLLDFDDLGIDLDNSEAISFGEILPDGRQSLIVVSDNNFNDTQETQFLAFAIGEADVDLLAGDSTAFI